MQKYFNNIASKVTGLPLSGASVQVNVLGGGAATIYSDNGVTPRANPITTDSAGYFEFYAADGRYSIVISGTGFTAITISDILLEDPADADAFNVSTLTAAAITLNGNLNLSGSARRITGDFTSQNSSLTGAWVQTSTANSSTILQVAPSGSGANANLSLHTSSTPESVSSTNGVLNANTSGFDINSRYLVNGTAQDGSSNTGFVPINFKFATHVAGIIAKNGDVSLGMAYGVAVPALKLVGLASAARGFTMTGSVAGDSMLGTTAGNINFGPGGGVVKAGVDSNGLVVYSGTDPANANVLSIQSVAAVGHEFIGTKTGTGVTDMPFYFLSNAGGNPSFTISSVASVFNGITVGPAANGGDVSLTATGANTDINLRIGAKGTRNIHFLTGLTYNSLEMSIAPTSGGAARYLIVGGSSGSGAPYVTTSAGNLSLGSATGGIVTVNDGAGGVNFAINNAGGGVQRNWIAAQGSVSGGGLPGLIAQSDGTDVNVGLQIISKGTGSIYFATNGGGSVTYQAQINHLASTDGFITFTGGNATTSPKISISGVARNLVLGSGAALATGATDGYIMIPSCAGAPTGVPRNSGAGQIAMHYDSTNNRIYFYNGAWRSVAVA